MSIGAAQWFVLRDHVARAGRWIVTNVLAWTVGLAVFVGVTTPLWHPGQPVGLVVTIGVLGGLVMAAALATVTGFGLLRLLARTAGG